MTGCVRWCAATTPSGHEDHVCWSMPLAVDQIDGIRAESNELRSLPDVQLSKVPEGSGIDVWFDERMYTPAQARTAALALLLAADAADHDS